MLQKPNAGNCIVKCIVAGLALSSQAIGQCMVYRNDMPDFDQKRAGLLNDGNSYCVPTATANALAYISNHGYPSAFAGGPRDWASQDQYIPVTTSLFLMGFQMGTDPDNGTPMNNWFNYTKSALSGVGYFGVSKFHTFGYVGLSPKTLSDQMRMGAIVLPVMGWYEWRTGSRWRRNGGHMVTMWGAFDTCGSVSDMRVAFRDPANDSILTSQGPFTTTMTGFNYIGGTYAMKNETDFYPRIVYRLDATNGFLDGYGSIWPTFGLTTNPIFGDVTMTVPQPLTDEPEPKHFDLSLATGAVMAVGHGPSPTEGYILAKDALGRLGTLYLANFVDGTTESIASMSTPRGMVVSRDGTAYVASSSRISRYAPQADGRYAVIQTVDLPNPADAMFYDDETDEVVAMNVSNRQLLRISRELVIRRSDLIPTSAAVLGDGSVAVNPIDGKEWIAGSQTATVARLGRDGTGRLLPEALVGLPGVTSPRSLQFGDDGTLFVVDGGRVKAFEPNGAGGWRAATSHPLHDQESGSIFTVGRSRTNYDPIMDDDNVLPPDYGMGEPDCRADLNKDGRLDIFDFLEFQNLFARGSTWADFDHDGRLTIFDFLAYQNAFAAGCP